MFKPIQGFALTLAGIYGVMRALQMAPTIIFPFLEGRSPEYASSVWGLGVLAALVALLVLGAGLIWRYHASFHKEDFSKEILPLGIAVAGGLMIIAGISGAISQAGVMIYLWQANGLSPNDLSLSVSMGLFSFAAHAFRVVIGAVFLMRTERVARLTRQF